MKKFTDEIANLNMSVTDDSDFLSPYAETGKPVISTEVADFLTTSANAYHPKTKLKINIKSDCISEAEKPVYKAAIRNYFALQSEEVVRDMRRKTVTAIWFAIVGILGLAFMFLLGKFGVNDLWVECVDIFAWVFLWEAVDQFFIERGGLLLKSRRIQNFIEAEINYL